MTAMTIRSIEPRDEDAVAALVEKLWGSRNVVTRGRIYDAATLPGFLALEKGEVVGLLTFRVAEGECEVVTLDALISGRGIGSLLLKEAEKEARARGCRRLWLITTNNNIDAIVFYQKRGFRMVAIHQDAVTEARKLKPQIPLIGENSIPIRDEVEFEIELL